MQRYSLVDFLSWTVSCIDLHRPSASGSMSHQGGAYDKIYVGRIRSHSVGVVLFIKDSSIVNEVDRCCADIFVLCSSEI
jgi:hypothetical protein